MRPLPPPLAGADAELPSPETLRASSRDAERLQMAMLQADAYPPPEQDLEIDWRLPIAVCLGSAVVALFFLTGCGGPGSTSLVGGPTPTESAPQVNLEPPTLALAPDAASETWTLEAIEAWSGIANVYLDPSGIPVRGVTELVVPCLVDGVRRECLPNAAWDGDEIRVRIDRDCPARSTAHEIGHVLGLGHLPPPSLMQSPAPVGCPEWSVGEDVAAKLGGGS